ncbi:MAG: AMP-binding protein [Rhodospirillaceae bacterium]|nr:AMP-binding protein [Rhodospirillaceae bacterium]MBT6118936.1 AMP-binding protein [Rhodospirillaceae bacterium]
MRDDAPLNAARAILEPALSAGAARQPALIAPGETLSYGALEEGAGRAAGLLAAEGLRRGGRVLLLLDDSPAFVLAYLGALRLGALPVAFNPGAVEGEIGFVLCDCAPGLVIAEPRARQGVEGAAPLLEVSDFRARLAGYAPPPIAETRSGESAFLIYTSGSTGMLKAALHRHRSVLPTDRYLRETLGLGPGDRVHATSRLFFAYALGAILFGTLRLGAAAVLDPAWPSPENLLAVLRRDRPDAVFSVPSFYRKALVDGVGEDAALRAVRLYVSAGEALPEGIAAGWRDAVGREILDGMGTSETICMLLASAPGAAWPDCAGRPAPGAELRLLDEAGTEVAAGTPGQLWARIDSLAAGYWNRPEETARAFRDGWFRTGDLFEVGADGGWRHVGRSDDMFKVSGQWVSPAEIEQAVGTGAGLQDCALVGLPDADGLPVSVLFAVLGAGSDRTAAEAAVRKAAAGLPGYKRPTSIRFVAEIPRTATGKIRRFRLRESIRTE